MGVDRKKRGEWGDGGCGGGPKKREGGDGGCGHKKKEREGTVVEDRKVETGVGVQKKKKDETG